MEKLDALRKKYTLPGLIICALGLVALAAMYVYWLMSTHYSLWANLAAFASVTIFAVLCLRFVPGWMRFWTPGGWIDAPRIESTPAHMSLKLFGVGMLWCLAVFIISYVVYLMCGFNGAWSSFMNFWSLTDSGQTISLNRSLVMSVVAYGFFRSLPSFAKILL